MSDSRPTIALLPLANAGGDPDKAYYAAGLTELLHGALVGVRALHVASRGAAAALDGQVGLAELAKALGVGHVLDGSVTRLGGQLRVSVRLMPVQEGVEGWAESLDRPDAEPFAVLRHFGDRVLETLGVVPTAEERRALEHVPTRDLRAFDSHLRARAVSAELRRASQELAVQLYGDAVASDPGFALAHAGLAEAHSLLFTYWVSSAAHLEAADAASERGVTLAPMLAETHLAHAVALSLNRRPEAAEQEFQTTLALKPNLAEAHYHYARHCRTTGRLEDAARWFESTARLRPEDYATPALLASVYVGLGRPDDARRAQRRALERAERHLKRAPDDERALYLGAGCLASLSEPNRAREWVRRAVAMEPDDSAVLYNVACVYALLGLVDSAIDLLERAVANGFGHWEWIEHDSDFDGLRAHPRFQAVSRRPS